MRDFDGFGKYSTDETIETAIEEHLEKFHLSPLDAIKLFPVLARRQALKRFLAHVELFCRTLKIPGDIAELGVYRGLGLFTWANLLESYCIGDRTKIVYGFDNWQGFSEISPEDGQHVPHLQKTPGGFSPEKYYNELQSAIKLFDQDRFVPWKNRIRLVEGNLETSAKNFIQKNPGVRFSLIHFDCDLYRPTKAALTAFWPCLSRGGLMLFDEYGIPEWPGETKAVDEFLEEHPKVSLETFNWTNIPAAFLIKP